MAQYKFRCDVQGGLDECNVAYRGEQLETTGPMVFNTETRTFDESVEHDAKCIKTLEHSHHFGQLAFEKILVP